MDPNATEHQPMSPLCVRMDWYGNGVCESKVYWMERHSEAHIETMRLQNKIMDVANELHEDR